MQPRPAAQQGIIAEIAVFPGAELRVFGRHPLHQIDAHLQQQLPAAVGQFGQLRGRGKTVPQNMQVIALPPAVKFHPADGDNAQVLTGSGKALAAQPVIMVTQRGQPHTAVPAGQRGLLRGLGAVRKIAVDMQIDKHGKISPFVQCYSTILGDRLARAAGHFGTAGHSLRSKTIKLYQIRPKKYNYCKITQMNMESACRIWTGLL